VDLTAKIDMSWTALGKDTFLQLNVQNLFNEFYVGGFDGTFTSYQAPTSTAPTGSPTNANLGIPRTFMASLNIGF
jgi:iron complex outermembrane receptor protein